jgi:hypothetical protein
MNAFQIDQCWGSTFQRDMDYDFSDLAGKIIEIYQDDLTTISKKRCQHIRHMQVVFERCREYGVSLYPKKSIFGVDKGTLLGHIISKDVILVDPSIIEEINKIPLPKDKKSLQSFFRKINVIRIFIPNFAKIVKPLNCLLKGDACFEWDDSVKMDFQHIKEAITIALVLVSSNFTKDFIIFSFTSNDTIAGVI